WLRAFTNGDVGEGDRGRTNRHDQVEDASPADCVDQPTAEYWPDDESESVAARPNAQGVRALLAVRIGEGEQYQRHGHLEGGAQPADNASEDQYSGTRGKRADQCACDEQHDAQNKNPSTAVKIAKCPTSQQQACVNKIVGIDHPLHLTDPGAQVS